MCIAPNRLNNGSLVGCRNCWQCAERKILDWTGRCIAESKVCTASHSITLTYGRGLDGKNLGQKSHERAHVLTYSDVQKYFKRLRKDGFACSYFVVGEYGSTKGRSHWHAIVYWHGPVPPHEIRTSKYMQKHWPHGFSFWDEIGPASVRYVCKYVQKDLADAEAQGHLSMSKKPPLGARYFALRAQRYVDAGLAPQDMFYSFDEARDRDGNKLKFLLGGRSAELFLEEYIMRWRGYPPRGFHGPPCPVRGWHYPASTVVEEYEDKLTRNRVIQDEFVITRDTVVKGDKPTYLPQGATEILFSQKHNAYYTMVDGNRLFWSYSNSGVKRWEDVIRIIPEQETIPALSPERLTEYVTRMQCAFLEI